MCILQKQWKRDCFYKLMSLNRDMFSLESGCFTSKHLILQLLKLTNSGAAFSRCGGLDWGLSEDNRGSTLLSRDFLRFMQYNIPLALVDCRHIPHKQQRFRSRFYFSFSCSRHHLEQFCTINNPAGKNNQNKELKHVINLHCFPRRG